MTEEDYLRQELACLQKSYAEAAKLIIDRLVWIESMRPRPPVMFVAADLPPDVLQAISAGQTPQLKS